MTSILKITGFRTGVKEIRTIQIFREELISSLADARKCLDDILIGKEVKFEIKDEQKVRRIAKELHGVGLNVQIET